MHPGFVASKGASTLLSLGFTGGNTVKVVLISLLTGPDYFARDRFFYLN